MRGTPYVQLNIFPDTIHKKRIYDPVPIFNFPEKIAQNKYICVGSYNIRSLLDISSPLDIWKDLDILVK